MNPVTQPLLLTLKKNSAYLYVINSPYTIYFVYVFGERFFEILNVFSKKPWRSHFMPKRIHI